MEKNYITIVEAGGKYSLDVFDNFHEAKEYVDWLVSGQARIEGELESVSYFGELCEDTFGQNRTVFFPFFGHVVYGVETVNSRGDKMNRVIIEVQK